MSNTRAMASANTSPNKTMHKHISTSSATSVDTFTSRKSTFALPIHHECFWKCVTCTYENSETDEQCEMCNEPKPEGGCNDEDDEEETNTEMEPQPVRITMQKVDGRRFGLSISSTAEGHFVEKVASNGLAAETGQVTVGMKLIAINGVNTTELSKVKCIELFKQASEGVTLDLLDVGYGMINIDRNLSDTPNEYSSEQKRQGLLNQKQTSGGGSNNSLSAFPGRKMSTPEAMAAAEHVEDLTRMLDSLKSFAGEEEDGHGADDQPNEGLKVSNVANFKTSMAFVKAVLQRAAQGCADGRTVQDLVLAHWGEDLDSSTASGGGDWNTSLKEKEKDKRKIMRLESESRSIAKRLLDQQTSFASQLNALEAENESLRAYVDRLMGQLLNARMEQPMLMLQEEEKKRMSRRTRSPRMPRPSSVGN